MQFVKISLPTWKKIERVLKEVDRLGFANAQAGAYGGGETVLMQNDSGVHCERFHILQISGVVVTPDDSLQDFQQRPVFTGAIPSADQQANGRLVFCAEPIAPGEIGPVWVDGIVMTRIDVTDSSHNYATAKSGDQTQLASAAQGLSILYKQSGLGQKWGLVRYSSSGGSGLRMAYIKDNGPYNSSYLQAYLDDNITGDVVDVYFTLLAAQTIQEGHYTLTAGVPIPVAMINDQWTCLIPLQGAGQCTPAS